MKRDIPHIDLRDYRSHDKKKKELFVKTLGDGLVEFGFLTVEGHDVDESLVQKTYKHFHDFFALNEEIKRKYDGVAGGARGYTPFGREHAKNSPFPDLKEFWHVGQELPVGHYLESIYQPNVWPSEIQGMQETTMKLFRSLENCAQTILQALAEYFGLSLHTFSSMMEHGNSILRPIHYPPIEGGFEPNSIRAAAHEDINLITLLVESKGSGLEVLTRDGKWLAVDALAGDIVVDSGDMLSRCTNNKVPATTHRVVNPSKVENKSRYSMPFFVHPFADCDLTVLERFVSAENPAQYPPITADEFLQQRLREIGLIK